MCKGWRFWHKWSNWKSYLGGGFYPHAHQMRVCIRCNYVQNEVLPSASDMTLEDVFSGDELALMQKEEER